MSEGISVVICTRDRVDSLTAVLDRYLSMAGDLRWNAVIVDDGSSDGTSAVIADRSESSGGRIRGLRTTGVGLGAARNVGWRGADRALILFTDDDCFPAPDLFDRVFECFTDPRMSFVGGRLLPLTAEEAAVAVVTRTDRIELVAPQFVPAGLLPGANLTVRRSALESIGGFDPEFGAGTPFAAEDVELVARLVAGGFQGAYDPRPVVHHAHGRTSTAAQEVLRRAYDRGRGAYYAKCLRNSVLGPLYRRAWLRSACKGSWARTAREVGGAWRYWTRPRSAVEERS